MVISVSSIINNLIYLLDEYIVRLFSISMIMLFVLNACVISFSFMVIEQFYAFLLIMELPKSEYIE